MKNSIRLIITLLFLSLLTYCMLPTEEEIEKKPEISIEDDSGTTIFPTTGSYEFDDTEIGSKSEASFVIINTGDGELTLTGSPLVDVTGSDASEFEVLLPSTSKISAPGQASFKITFSPKSAGEKSAIVTITNNDENKSFYRFTITGTATGGGSTGPEINILIGSTSIASGGNHDVGSTLVGTDTNITTFTIKNSGSSDLTLSGSDAITLSGTNSSDFALTQPSSTTITPSGEDTFTLVFQPSSEGSKTATLTIENNDSDESTYTITINGTATNTAQPEINLIADETSISTSGSFNFGSVNIGSSTSTTFTIQNIGSATLNLTGTPLVNLSGTNSADFSVSGPSVSTVSASGNTTFTVTFTPSSQGAKTATLTIENNDIDEASYSITLNGTATIVSEPEIDLIINSSSTGSGGTHDFGSVNIGSSSNVTMTIENKGNADLNLTGSSLVALSGANSSEFSVSGPSSSTISASGNLTFTVTFSPTTQGTKTATITIENNDSDEGTFTLILNGNGTVILEPEINVLAGNSTVLSSGSYDVGSVEPGSSNTTIFTIENKGTVDLNLTGTPIVEISGTNSSDFVVTGPSSSTISASGSITFTVGFNPSTEGPKTAALTIINNDTDEGTYTITLTGSATVAAEPEINIVAGENSIASSGTFNIGSAEIGSSLQATLKIQNSGNAALNITSSIGITGTNAADFTVSGPSSTTVSAGGEVTFTVTFSPTIEGLKTALLTIESNDSNEGTYTITLTGTADPLAEPEINILAGLTQMSLSGTYTFADTQVGSSSSKTFTIENSGNADLVLAGSPIIKVSGTHASNFVITQPSASTIPPSGNLTFSITFAPSAEGVRTATITISNNDNDEAEFIFTVTGVATPQPAPEINLLIGATTIASSGSYNVGTTEVGSIGISTTFTIQNTGNNTLNLIGSPLVQLSGTNSSDFSITQPITSTITASGNTTFTVHFNPSDAGTKVATLMIQNNDSDENPYIITLTGAASAPPEPEINLIAGTTSVPSFGTYDFGTAEPGSTGITTTFTIQNTGTDTLNLLGSPYVEVSGTDSYDFYVTQPTVSTISASGSTTFSIEFYPSMLGSKTATVTILNNDSDEGTYTITITATAATAPKPEIDISLAGSSIPSNGSIDFGNVELDGTGSITFTIFNNDAGTLNFTGNPVIALSGTDASLFSVTQPSVTSLIQGENIDVNVSFNPDSVITTTGSKTAILTIFNNDSDEGTYRINLNGTATLTASKVVLTSVTGSSTVNNNSEIELRATVTNANNVVVTDYTGNIPLFVDSGFTLSPSTIPILSGGSGTNNINVSQNPLYYDTPCNITASALGLTSGTLGITVIAVFDGTEITAADLTDGETILSGTRYIKPMNLTDPAIPVGGQILIGYGAKLVIYRGVTLDMRNYDITVNGTLEILGTNDHRVRLKSSTNSWGGIWVGTTSGLTDGILLMDGAYIDGTSSSPVTFGYSSAGTYRANSSVIRNSRLEVSSSIYREVIDFMYPKSGSTYTIQNNILVSGSENPIYLSGNSDGSITVNISYNTIVGKGSNSIAIDIRTNIGSNFTISSNIFRGNLQESVYSYNESHSITLSYNIALNNPLNGGSAAWSIGENLYFQTSPWDDNMLFTNYSANDFRLLQTGQFPELIAAHGYQSMVGSLANNHPNQRGAYGNGGTPPVTPYEN